MRYYGFYGTPTANNNLTLDIIRANFLPYRYGYITEMNVTSPGNYSAKKHYAMGRASHELTYCLPDNKTCFLTGFSPVSGVSIRLAARGGARRRPTPCSRGPTPQTTAPTAASTCSSPTARAT